MFPILFYIITLATVKTNPLFGYEKRTFCVIKMIKKTAHNINVVTMMSKCYKVQNDALLNRSKVGKNNFSFVKS